MTVAMRREVAQASVPRGSLFESDQLGLTEAFLSAHYTPMRIGSGSRGRSPARITRAAAGDVSVDRPDLGFVMSYDAEPLGTICLCDIRTGSIEDHQVDGGRSAESFGPGQVSSLAPPDRPCRGRIDHARYGITMLEPALLDGVAAAADDHHPVRLLDHLAFIEADPARAMTLTEIAAAAHVTPRALQYAFTRHLGTTPMAYLRRVRLDAAHHDLLGADPRRGDTVTAVATRWVFAHVGRLATAYREAYGRAPSRTLHG